MTDQLARFDDAALETVLRSLAPSIDWPSAAPVTPDGAPAGPDIATRVRARIVAGERPPASRSWWDLRGRRVSRALVLAVVALLALAIAAGAVGLRLPGLRFIFGEPPPSAVPSPTAPAVVSPGASSTARPTATPTPTLPPIAGMKLGLGQQVSLDEVEGLTGVPVRLPVDDRLGPPDAVWVDRGRANQIAYVWAADADLPETSEPGVGLVFMRFGGRTDDGFYQKVIGSGTHITRVDVGGHDGWWIDGDMHFFFYQDPNGRFVDDGRRWVGDALVWTDGTTTYRIESQLGRDATIALAESMS
jgi:hypothetical protein